MISPVQAGFTLPPIQTFSQPPAEQAPRPLAAYEPPPPFTPSNSNPRVVNATSSFDQDHNQEQVRSPQDSSITRPSPPSQLHINTSSEMKQSSSPPAAIKKEEAVVTPSVSSPTEIRRANAQVPDVEKQSMKAIASLKNEHGLRTHSPLRESSVPVPSTETVVAEPSNPKKRPAPSKTKKGTATTTTKKAPPAKKRKVEPKRSVTPSSRTSKPLTFKTGSSKGTPANSSPAPSTRSQSEEYDEQYDEDDDMDDGDVDPDGDVYCICRKPDNGTFMIGCDGTCDDWFHGKCVGIEERDKNLIDKYVCPNCTKAGAGKTTWKRMCRRSGCRQPARVGKTKGGKDGSKYCSEECGVMYFREMVARTRGREDTIKHRGSRRKSSLVNIERPTIDYDLGARGGTLAAGELKSLINSSTTADDFKKLGEGVLSPPATPVSKSPTNNTAQDGDYTESETQALQEIHHRKETSRRKHQLLKDRMKFVTMVKQAATRTAAEKELKPKEYCGYDSRLEWNDEQFAAWRNSTTGKQAFELDTLATENSGSKGTDVEMTEDDHQEFEVCDRKKCARHLEWTKLAVDDVRFEMSDNSDHMRALEKEEKEIKERAALRAKAGSLNGEGSVEVHGLGISNSETGQRMDGVESAEIVETVEQPVAV